MLHTRTRALRSWVFATLFAPALFHGCSCGEDEPAPRIVSFTASRNAVPSGETVDLSWRVENAATVSISAAPGGSVLEASPNAQGMVTSKAIEVDTIFTLTAAHADGRRATSMVTVTVMAGGEVAIVSFDADPDTIAPNGTATLSWEVTGATSLRIDEVNGGNVLAEGDTFTGTVEVQPAQSTSYVLIAQGPAGPKMATVSVAVEGTPQITDFTAAPASIELGDSATLSWEVSDAETIIITDDATPPNEIYNGSDATGDVSVTPDVTTRYTLTARSALGQEATEVADVTVNRAARVVSFTASPDTIDYGDPSELQWLVERATSIDIQVGGDTVLSSTVAMGTFTVTPTATTDYTLIAYNPEGDTTATARVEVDPTAPRVLDFSASPNPALIGEMSSLSWSVAGAVAIQITDSAQNVVADTTAATGTVAVTVTATAATYTLAATNPNGTTRSTVILIGQNVPTIDLFEIVPLLYTGSSTIAAIRWDTTGATMTSLEIDGVADTAFPGTEDGTFTATITGSVDVALIAQNAVGVDRAELRVSSLVVEVKPNDTSSIATPIPGDGAFGAVNPGGDVDWYSITVPAGGNVWAQTSDGNGGCAFDTFLTLYASDGTTVLGSDDDEGFGRCSEIDPFIDDFAVNLTGGTYYLQVRGYGAADMGSYALLIRIGSPACGNGLLEFGEECDDTNNVSGDRCSATCTVEPAGLFTGPPLDQTIAGSITPAGVADYYQVTMLGPGYIDVETFVPVPGRCDTLGGGSADTEITLLDSNFQVLGSDDFNGIGNCSKIDARFDAYSLVQPGTYWVRVTEDGNNVEIPAYTVRIRALGVGCPNGIIEQGELCDDGNTAAGDGCSPTCGFEGPSEMEPNETLAEGTLLTGTPPFLALGSISPLDDTDYFLVDVPEGYHIDAYITVNGFDSCPQDPEGSIALYNPAGTQIASNTTGGPGGNCGRVWPYTDADARGLTAGRYGIRVIETGNNNTIGQYFLHVDVIAPGCGNRILEGAESCDDGNIGNGDGCSSTCTFEPEAMVTLPSAGTTTVAGAIDPEFDRDAIQLVVTQESYLIAETFAPQASLQACDVDTQLLLYAQDGVTLIGEDDFDGIGSCSLIHPSRDAFARVLPGTYWLAVEEDGNSEVIPSYEVLVAGVPVDVCGNGVPEAAEQCDDGNTTSGDGCAASCVIEPDATITGPPAVASFNGAITPVGDFDVYRLDLSAPSILIVETNNPGPGECQGGIDTFIRLIDLATGTELHTDDFDGINSCSLIDGLTETAGRVPAGSYFVTIEEDGNSIEIPNYVISFDIRPQDACGNGLQESTNNETCDDGNTTAGDGCSPLCSLEPDFTFTATVGNTAVFAEAINPTDDFDVIQIDVTQTVYLTAETFAPAVGACSSGNDTLLRLFGSDGTALGTDDDDGISVCSLIDRSRDGFARLTAGTYFLTVEEFGMNDTVDAYEIQLSAGPADICGDGIMEAANNEQCDDGNVADGDGCSSTCQVDIAQIVTVPSGVATFTDSILPATNVDTLRLDVTQESYVRIETFAPAYPECVTGTDTRLRLYDATFVELANDDLDGIGSCSLMDPTVDPFAVLAPGTYYLSVEEDGGNATIAAYQLRITSYVTNACGNFHHETGEECDDGNTNPGDGCSATCQIDITTTETEANDTFLTANPTGRIGIGHSTVAGNVTPAGDLDFFQIEVPAGSPALTLRARTYAAPGDPLSTCDSTIDTRLILLDSTGAELENDDDIDGASNRCSEIDGGRPGTDPDARLLPGIYYLRVSHFSSTAPAPAGPYFLEILLQP